MEINFDSVLQKISLLRAPPVAERFCPQLMYGRCWVLSPVALLDLAVRSFPWFSPKLL